MIDTGQITVKIDRACLQFRDPGGVKGQRLFLKCTFSGAGAKIFATSSSAIGEPLDDVITTSSESYLITIPDTGDVELSAGDNMQSDAAADTVIDFNFCVQSTKFDITADSLSELGATSLRLEVCLCGEGDGEPVAMGTLGRATTRLDGVLRGETESKDVLLLGTPADSLAAPTTSDGRVDAVQDGGHGGNAKTDQRNKKNSKSKTSGREESAEKSGLLKQGSTTEESSPGLLHGGGSTSTIHVMLVTDDDTADFAIGGGILSVEAAAITGIPDMWKMEPPRETGGSSWDDAIAQTLAAPPRHKYSLWWPREDGATEGTQARQPLPPWPSWPPLPPMKLGDGKLSYAASGKAAESTPVESIGQEKPDSDLGPASTSEENGGEEGGAPRPSGEGTWSVQFPMPENGHRVFLDRAAIRALRQHLIAGKRGESPPPSISGVDEVDDSGSGATNAGGRPGAEAYIASTTLPVFIRREELNQAAPSGVDQAGGGGKGSKKGKKGAGKAPVDQLVVPPEPPWLCRADLDLCALVGRRVERGEQDKPTVGDGPSGDSPSRVELRAKMTLDPGESMPLDSQEGEQHRTTESVVGATCAGLDPSTSIDSRIDEGPIAADVELRGKELEGCETTLVLFLELSRPLIKARARQEAEVSVEDIFVPKDVGPCKPVRDVDMELRGELDEFVQAILEEYAKLFLQPGSERTEGAVLAQDREKHLFYALNSGGLYHAFLERLKPRVQRVVRKRFGAAPTEAEENDTFAAELYAHLVKQAAEVLNQRVRNIEAKAIPSYVPLEEDKTLAERVDHLGVLADDAESRGEAQEAEARHQDRVEAATAAAAARADWRGQLARAWEDYARFCLRSRAGLPGKGEPGGDSSETLHRAARCLEESLGVYPRGSEESFGATALLAAIALEQDQLERARALLENIQEERLPALDEEADGYETDQLAAFVPRREHALRCLLQDLRADARGARRSLLLAVLAAKIEGDRGVEGAIAAEDDEPRAPRRSAVRVMHDLCEWLLGLGLPRAARCAFAVAEESEKLAVKKAKERSLPRHTPTTLRESSRRLRCRLILRDDHGTEASSVQRAESLAQEAVELLPADPRPWEALGEAYDAQGALKAREAAEAWAAALDRMETAWDSKTGPVPTLRAYMKLSSLYNSLGRTEDAKTCFLRACRAWQAPGPWLGRGVACLRLEQWEEAEEALHRASCLDCNSPLIWGYLALLLLSLGEERHEEGDRALSQALRLGLADSSLLRELGNCYVAVGRLEAAEGALRMSLAAEINDGSGGDGGGNDGGDSEGGREREKGKGNGRGGGNPHTRRRLADILSARNATAQAVEEYRRVLESPTADESEREEVLARCANLLRKMGRSEELEQLRKTYCCENAVLRETSHK